MWDAPVVMGARCPEVGEAGELGLGQKHQSFNSRYCGVWLASGGISRLTPPLQPGAGAKLLST